MKKTNLLLLVLICLNCTPKEKEMVLTNYQQWHTITLPFEGPDSSENAENNPFLNYCLTVEFKHEETEYEIRGFYAADGNAAETGASSGSI